MHHSASGADCVHAHNAVVCGPQRTLRIAVQGCAHGELDAIYETIAEMERSQGIKIDLLLCCGDFQARHGHSVAIDCRVQTK